MGCYSALAVLFHLLWALLSNSERPVCDRANPMSDVVDERQLFPFTDDSMITSVHEVVSRS